MRERPASRYEAVDLLRACAALSIVAFHTSQFCGLSFGSDIFASVLALLKVGVGVFFVISGFVLYLPCARAMRDRRPLPDWRRYGRRRAMRTLPAYYLAFVVCTAAGVDAGAAPSDWWRYLTLTQTYKTSTLGGGLGVAWTLCVEIAFYILLPFLARAIARLGNCQRRVSTPQIQLVILAALAGGSLLLRYTLTGNVRAMVTARHLVAASSLPCLFSWFAIGMALAVLAAAWESGSNMLSGVRRLSTRPRLCWLAAAVLYALVISERKGDVFLPQYDLETQIALSMATAFFVLPALGSRWSSEQARTTRTLSRDTLAWLGTVSYGIYLWHVSVVRVVMRLFFGATLPTVSHPASAFTYGLLVLIIGGCAITIGAASWYLLERPLQRWSQLSSGIDTSRPRPVPAVELAPELAR